MDPKMEARLQGLNQLVEQDLASLPVMPLSLVSDDDADGGIALDAMQEELESVDLAAGTIEQQASPKLTPQPEPEPEPTTQSTGTSSPSTTNENPEKRFIWRKDVSSSFNLGPAPKLSKLPSSKLAPSNLTQGELAPANLYFAPITALSKYPYKFCNPSNSQEIASEFFDAGKFWQREWDLYYVWDVDGTSAKPLVLVQEHQVDQLLAEINSALSLGLKITNQQREEGLLGSFPEHPRCRPRYLGRSNTRDEFDSMVANAPRAPDMAPPSGRTLEHFKKMMEDMWDVQKNKGKAAKEKKKQERMRKQAAMSLQFKRAQQFLALRPADPKALKPVDPSKPAPFFFENDVVFISIDVEAYEKNHEIITEVGMASLDTRDLVSIPPGKDGEAWRTKIQAGHFRIKEHKHLVNSEFVSGAPDKFEFGESEFVKRKEAPQRIAACFRAPFCKKTENVVNAKEKSKRSIVLLGHDTQTDVVYLQKLGFDPLNHITEIHDTAVMYRVWRREPQSTNLGKILYDFDIPGWNLHNAGNDAVYTVQAMLGICVREATIRGSEQLKASRDERKASHVARLTEEAKQRAQDETEGWSDEEL